MEAIIHNHKNKQYPAASELNICCNFIAYFCKFLSGNYGIFSLVSDATELNSNPLVVKPMLIYVIWIIWDLGLITTVNLDAYIEVKLVRHSAWRYLCL